MKYYIYKTTKEMVIYEEDLIDYPFPAGTVFETVSEPDRFGQLRGYIICEDGVYPATAHVDDLVFLKTEERGEENDRSNC